MQRVGRAAVRVDGEVVGAIDRGLLVLLGVGEGDDETHADTLADKTARLRIFPDDRHAMNRSLEDVGGAALVVSQFTLLADTRRGRRPSFVRAAPPDDADRLYQRYVQRLRDRGLEVATGVFQAMMDVELVNQGPVTILLEVPAPGGGS